MSIWDNVPYELQSPTWRSGMNNYGKPADQQSWDPGLNLSFVDKFADAFQTRGTLSTSDGVATAQVDGASGHTNWLNGLTGAILSGIGAQSERTVTPVAYTPVAQETTIAGLPLSTLAILGLGAAAIYYVASK